MTTDPGYTFGDSAIAGERLAVLAEAFAPTSTALLASIEGPVRRVLDLGCGPGFTTELLATCFPNAEIVAVEWSEAFAAQARRRVERATVLTGDVTAALPDGFDLVYSRFLLSHLTDVAGAVRHWCRSLAPGGSLVLEEPESIVAHDPLFARYEAVVAAVVARSGADMYVGATLGGGVPPKGFEHRCNASVDPYVTAGAAAAMFWRNARAWDASVDVIVSEREREELIAELQARVDDPSLDAISWRIRQLVLARTAPPGPKRSLE